MDIFRFKHFEILQGNGVFKVNTDGVLLGIWADISPNTSILEIGSGTGVVSCIAFYKSNRTANITAIDISQEATDLTKQNFQHNQIADFEVICSDIADYKTTQTFDTILCNPPYFINALLPTSALHTTAKHQENFGLDLFFERCVHLLNENGVLHLIFPFDNLTLFAKEASHYKLNISRICFVRYKRTHSIKRVLVEMKLVSIDICKMENLSTMDGKGKYSAEYSAFATDYYLAF